MDSERWKQIQEIFADAGELEGGERAAMLEARCGGDAELRREVESLLGAEWSATDLIEGAVASEARLASAGLPDELAGRMFGPYRVVRRLGQGGMGDVYLASRADDQYQKFVAIKVVRGGASPNLLERFRYERQILADLDHPNIARLLDGGVTVNGLPYLVMEYVDGLEIEAYCDQNRLSSKRRLRLFIDVCAAVEYAHRNLVVHRDIKPSNILVTSEGVPKLLDFGIAKLLRNEEDADHGLTRTGMQLLTPDYASPEQVKGEPITTATDVYSLGVLLFELMTGHRPYAARDTSLGAVGMAICESQPPKPSRAILEPQGEAARIAAERGANPKRLRRELAGDVDSIILTALRKEPERRYASAGQFAEDIRRHIEGLPIRASEDSWSYRTGKFVRRHKIGVAFAALLAIVLMASAAALYLQNLRVARERDAAVTERRTADETVSFFLDLFRLADPGETRGNAITAREILDKGAERIRTELKSQPAVQASMMEAIAQVYENLGLEDKAAPLLRAALATRRRVSGERSEAYAKTLKMAAQFAYDRGQYAAARAQVNQDLRLWRELGGEQSDGYADALQLDADIDAVEERFDSAGPKYRQLLDLYQHLDGADSLQRATVMNNYGLMLYDAKKYADAEKLQRQALAIREKRLGKDDPDISESLNNLAIVLSSTGRFAESRKLQQEALDLDEKLYGDVHPYIGTELNNLGMVEYSSRHYKQADRYLRRALEVRRLALGTHHPDYAISLDNLAKNLMAMRQFAEAERYEKQALKLNRELYGNESPRVAQSWNILGAIYYGEHHWKVAESTFRTAIALYPGMKPSHTFEMSSSVMGLGQVLLKTNDLAQSEKLLREAVRLRMSIMDPHHWPVAWAQTLLAECLVRRGKIAEARSLAVGAEPTIRQELGDGGPAYDLVEKVLKSVSTESENRR
jgi:eukaryotic-like serine/threonine-protein kinase